MEKRLSSFFGAVELEIHNPEDVVDVTLCIIHIVGKAGTHRGKSVDRVKSKRRRGQELIEVEGMMAGLRELWLSQEAGKLGGWVKGEGGVGEEGQEAQGGVVMGGEWEAQGLEKWKDKKKRALSKGWCGKEEGRHQGGARPGFSGTSGRPSGWRAWEELKKGEGRNEGRGMMRIQIEMRGLYFGKEGRGDVGLRSWGGATERGGKVKSTIRERQSLGCEEEEGCGSKSYHQEITRAWREWIWGRGPR
ncbi:hypothetical protein AMTR_s00018p00083650 [Amborella trichopoda]|uniref:Uncharacterized protein n=1 Tax=Amborella trichopoda TaxID=13333 RepID=W1PK74_AMBTC|nr:hypothetical protein AMTR_s00018p00083650 [Amborella trichopoda]